MPPPWRPPPGGHFKPPPRWYPPPGRFGPPPGTATPYFRRPPSVSLQQRPPTTRQADLGTRRPREVLVVLTGRNTEALQQQLGRELRLTPAATQDSTLLGGRVVLYRIPDNRPLDSVIGRLASDTRVTTAQPNYVFRLPENDFGGPTPVPQYALAKLHVAEAHHLARGRNVLVAVIDTGIDAEHSELHGTVAGAFDALGEEKRTLEWHGTAIAGVLAAHSRLIGMAPEANLLTARAFTSSDRGPPQSTTLILIRALEWASSQGARVFNMSFAGPKDPLLLKLIETAESRGKIFIAAAGNGGAGAPPAYPAAHEKVIAVTATDSADRLYKMANRGAYIAVAAPGVDVLVATPKEKYGVVSGTSLAAAHVSGIVALLLERRPDLTTEQVRAVLSRTARDLGHQGGAKEYGAGLADALKAVQELTPAPVKTNSVEEAERP